MGQKLPPCGQLGPARSRQDESKEVGEAGSKRTSSRGKEGHRIWWSRLIFRLLFLFGNARVCVRVHALRAARLLRGKCLVLVRHAACVSVWACADQRHSTEDPPMPH
jgi:hypothetical protein